MTSTPYGSGPLPDPESGGSRVPEERDWNEGQRTTRRAALLTAAGFGLAGLAAFAMVSSPFAVTLDNAQMARADSARVQPRAVPRAGVRAPRAASDRGRAIPGGYRDARLAAPRDAKLGSAAVQPVDAEAYWHKIVDPMPMEPRRHLEQLASVAPTLPEAQYQELMAIAADVAWRTDPGARERAEELVELLSYLTGMEDVKEGMEIHYRRVDSGNTEKAPSEIDPMEFANFVKAVLPSCRAFPTWDQADVQKMQDATWLISQQYQATHSKIAAPFDAAVDASDPSTLSSVEADPAVTDAASAQVSDVGLAEAATDAWTYDYSKHQTGDDSVDLLSKASRSKWALKEAIEVKAKIAASARLGAATEAADNSGDGIDAFAEWWKVTNDLPQKDQDMLVKLRQMVPTLTEEDYHRCMDIADDLNWKIDGTAKAKAKELRDKLAYMIDVSDIDAGLAKHYDRLVKKHYGVQDQPSELEISPAELAEFVRDVFPAARNFPKWNGADVDKMRIVAARAKQRAAATAHMGQKKVWGQATKDAVAAMGKRTVDSRKENAALGQINNAPGIWSELVDHMPTQPRQHFYQMLQSVPYIEETNYRKMLDLAGKLQTTRDGTTKATLDELMAKLPYLTGTDDIQGGLDQHFKRINSGKRNVEAGEVSIDRLAEFVLDVMPPIRHWPNWSDDDISRMRRVTARVRETFEATHPNWNSDETTAHLAAPLGKDKKLAEKASKAKATLGEEADADASKEEADADASKLNKNGIDPFAEWWKLTDDLNEHDKDQFIKLRSMVPTLALDDYDRCMELAADIQDKVDYTTKAKAKELRDRLAYMIDVSELDRGLKLHYERLVKKHYQEEGWEKADIDEITPTQLAEFVADVFPAARRFPEEWGGEEIERMRVVTKRTKERRAAMAKAKARLGSKKASKAKATLGEEADADASKEEADADASKLNKNGIDPFAEWWKLTDDLNEHDKDQFIKLRSMVPTLALDDYDRCMELAADIQDKVDYTTKAKAKELRDRLAYMIDVSELDRGLKLHYERLVKKHYQEEGWEKADIDEITPTQLAEFVADVFPAARRFPEEWGGEEIERMRVVTKRTKERRAAMAKAKARLGSAPDWEANTDATKLNENGIDAYAEWWKLTNDLPARDNQALISLRQRVPGLTEEDYQRCMNLADDINWKVDGFTKSKAKELRDRLAYMMDVSDIDAGLEKHYARLYKKMHGVNDPATLDEISPMELAEFVRDIFPAARKFPDHWSNSEIAKMRIVTARARQRATAAAGAAMGQKTSNSDRAAMGLRTVDSRKENAALGQINNAPAIWSELVDHMPLEPRQHLYQMLNSVPGLEEEKYQNMIQLASKLQTTRDGTTKATLDQLMTKLPYLTGTDDIQSGLDMHFKRINSHKREAETGEVSIDRLAEFVIDTMIPIRHWPNWSDDDITRMQRVTNRIQEQFEATHPDWVNDEKVAHKSAPLGKSVDAEQVFGEVTSALPAGPRGVLEKLVANTPTIPEEHFQYIMKLSDELATKIDGSTRMSVNQVIDRLSTLADLSDIKAGVDAHFRRVDSRGTKKVADKLEVSPEKFGKFLQNVLPACRSYPTWTTEDAVALEFAADFLKDRWQAAHPGEKLPAPARKSSVAPQVAKGTNGVKSARALQEKLSTASRDEILDFADQAQAAMGLRKRQNVKKPSGKHQPLFREPAMKSERKGSAAKAELGAVVFVDAPTEWARLVDRLPDYEKNKIYKLKEVIPTLSEEKYNSLIALADSIRFSSETDGTKKARIKQLLTDVSALNVDVGGVGVGLANYWARIERGGTEASLAEISPDEFAEFVRETFPPIRDYPLWSVIDVEHLETATNRMVQRHEALNGQPRPGAAALGGRQRPRWKRRPDHKLSEEHKKPLGGVIPGQTDYAKLPLSEFANVAKNKGKLGEAFGTKHGRDPITGESYNFYEGNFVAAAFDPADWNLPLNFDARQKWPQCRAIIGTVRDQGKCGSCWAVATAEVMNDRLCIASGGAEQRELSPQYPLSCYDGGSGCQGGDVAQAMHEATTKGMVFGGMLNRSKTACLPYEFEPCEHPCQVQGVIPHECPAHVDDGTCLGNTFKLADQKVFPKSDVYTCPPNDWACIAQEIMTYGPVAVTFGTVHSDFYGYHAGVYTVREEDKNEEGLGMHATKLIGWGFDEATGHPYWLMMNSWDNWGIHGLGRVGVGEMNMEQGIAMVRM